MNYAKINETRKKRFLKIAGNDKMLASALIYYGSDPVAFINDWGITYDPRNAGTDKPTLMPFILFDRQKEFVLFLKSCLDDKECGVVEKCRDMGATWVACNFAIWVWLFKEGSSIGFGSRKEQLVDKLADPDSIFQKMRMVIDNLPSFFKPKGFSSKEHYPYMRIINPENTSTITGEAGDSIGRGGRKSIFFKDESSFYDHPETIEASLGDNTDVQIDISSVNGPNTVFQRKVESGETWEVGKKMGEKVNRVFIFDWRDHPGKNQEWYDLRKAKAEKEGMLHVFASEVDRDASAAVEGTVIPSEWLKAALDAHIKLKFEDGISSSAFDVADEGTDRHAVATKNGVTLIRCEDWYIGDTSAATKKALFLCRLDKSQSLQYDCIGVGAGVKAETNRLYDSGVISKAFKVIPWNASAAPLLPNANVIHGDKQSPKNKDFYANLKAQAWWQLRLRFEKTYRALKGDSYPEDELISISTKVTKVHELIKELSQPTYSINIKGKMVIDKNPSGSKSPNRADSVMMAFWGLKTKKVLL